MGWRLTRRWARRSGVRREGHNGRSSRSHRVAFPKPTAWFALDLDAIERLQRELAVRAMELRGITSEADARPSPEEHP